MPRSREATAQRYCLATFVYRSNRRKELCLFWTSVSSSVRYGLIGPGDADCMEEKERLFLSHDLRALMHI
jgi:hypothetical protein